MSFPSLPPPLRQLLPHRYRRRSQRRRINLMLYLLLTLFLLLTPIYLIYKPPLPLITYFSRRWPTVLWHIPASRLPLSSSGAPQKIVALTFDDAPSEFTEGILRLLEKYGATATFFVIGSQIEGREQVLELAMRQGCEVANHAMYDFPSRDLSDEQLSAQILEVEARLTPIRIAANIEDDAQPRYFRPGSGFFSGRMLRLMEEMGYTLVLGSVYPHDAQVSWWWVNARHVLSMLRPGAVIITHDRRSWTLPMLERVLAEGTGRGWRFVAVGELLEMVR